MAIKVMLNDDINLVNKIKEKLKNNDGYCPCVLTKRPEDKCMCKNFREQISQNIEGECHCGLYVSKNI